MRRQEKEIRDSNVISEILEKSMVCRLGLVDNDEAYIVPVNYAYDGGRIYIHSAPEGRKIRLIKKNNAVSFEAELPFEIIRGESACQWSAKYRSVTGRGVVTIEDDPESKKHGMDLIMKKYGAGTGLLYDEESLSRLVILKLEIISVTGKQSGEWQ
ncbi:MAG TPA: pyridoxamine 5'-phosphate oxidase family protein [Bacteroidales bacterium]|jgi:hypothetical protein|nr:pyridoxamine 5'-phosphate oxidase family protein [Bacteroidales bacterium]HQH23976.1 pyridoxamine 5'-phosphate oxidase family protein [Bacteroidales bacterium]HQJ81306.1 pyridoxamine 5'-phosphate oxidase family protein [Bacteroidales bacterium]